MNKTISIAILLLLAIGSTAVAGGTKHSRPKKKSVAKAAPGSLTADSLQRVIDFRCAVADSLNGVVNHLKNDNDSLRRIIGSYERGREVLESQVRHARQERNAMGFVDSIVYKQCLLYPLECRYNETLVSQARHSLGVLGIWRNPNYEEYCAVYREMLESYGRYNEELYRLTNRWLLHCKKMGGIDDFVLPMLSEELRHTEYYIYYAGRNKPPYKSIPYLDAVVEGFEKLIANGSNSVTQDSLQKILNMLTK